MTTYLCYALQSRVESLYPSEVHEVEALGTYISIALPGHLHMPHRVQTARYSAVRWLHVEFNATANGEVDRRLEALSCSLRESFCAVRL